MVAAPSMPKRRAPSFFASLGRCAMASLMSPRKLKNSIVVIIMNKISGFIRAFALLFLKWTKISRLRRGGNMNADCDCFKLERGTVEGSKGAGAPRPRQIMFSELRRKNLYFVHHFNKPCPIRWYAKLSTKGVLACRGDYWRTTLLSVHTTSNKAWHQSANRTQCS